MRLEYKYLVPNKVLDKIRVDVLPFLNYDKNIDSDNTDYTVRSIYFDNSRLTYYDEKVEGIKVRKKVRIRGYDKGNGKNTIFLELKKKNMNFIFKNRASLLYEDLNRLFETGDVERFILAKDNDDKNIHDGKKFFYHFHNKSLRPIILIVYEREAFFCKFDERLRITFDKNLRYLPFPALEDLFTDQNLNNVFPDSSILEIKFKHSMPLWLQHILTKYGLSRRALSKYVICLDEYAKHYPLKSIIRSAFSNNFMLDNYSNGEKVAI